MHFANTQYFIYALWLPLGLALLWLFWQWRRQKLNAMADAPMLKNIFPAAGNRFWLISGLLILIASGALILAMANPLAGAKPIKGKKSGLDIVIALDVSKSMDAQDIKPSRLARSLRFISSLSEKLAGNRIGLVVFAGNAYIQMPLTTDASAVKLFMADINTNMLPEPGTAIGDAIATSKSMLFPTVTTANARNAAKVMVLITDGENHEDDAENAAKDAAKNGMIIYTIGAGSEAGGPIPLYDHDNLQGYLKDENGETVVSKLDIGSLREIAHDAHGEVYRLTDQDDLAQVLVNKLGTLTKGEMEFEIYDQKQTQFQWFAGVALFLLLLECFISYKKASA